MYKTTEEHPSRGIGVFRCGKYFNWRNDILVTVNFTSLQVPSIERTHLSSQSILVRLSFTNDTQKAVTYTRPSLLAPGIDLIGISQSRIQKTFKNTALSAFGFFDVRSMTFQPSDPLVDVLIKFTSAGHGNLLCFRDGGFQ